MEIWHLGHSCFKIKGKQATILIDPFDPSFTGLKFPSAEADIVLITHDHKDHNASGLVKGNPVVFDGPGEYESKGVKIYGTKTFHDNNEGKERGDNTIYQITLDGLNLLHLGDLGHKLKNDQEKDLKTPDILFIPVGGYYTIDSHTALDVIAHLEPRIIVPMHYQVPGLKDELITKLAPLSDFLKKMGKEEIQPQQRLHITKDTLPSETTVFVIS